MRRRPVARCACAFARRAPCDPCVRLCCGSNSLPARIAARRAAAESVLGSPYGAAARRVSRHAPNGCAGSKLASWSARAARCPACPIRLHRHPFDHDAPPLRGHAARTLLASALAVCLSCRTRLPQPRACADPLQGDGRVSAFYTWDRDIPATPGVLLRTEPLPATLGPRAPAASCASSMHRPTASAAARRSPCRVRCSCRAARRRPAAGRSSRGRTARSGWPTSARRRGSAARIATCAT